VLFYPNPAQSNVYVSCENIHKIELFNVSGNLINKYYNNQDNYYQTIDISNLNNGIYFIKVTDKHGNSVSKKLIKNK
jgi:hypothetical protein